LFSAKQTLKSNKSNETRSSINTSLNTASNKSRATLASTKSNNGTDDVVKKIEVNLIHLFFFFIIYFLTLKRVLLQKIINLKKKIEF
jgi:hypothetical protein